MRDIELQVAEHEFVCLVGPSGCGKTTLLRVLAGLTAPSPGSGPAFTAEPNIAIVFQDYGRALLPWRTVSGNVALALEARRHSRG